MTRHKWAHVAEAFGNGKQIQQYVKGKWSTWIFSEYPGFYAEEEWRIKPDEPAPLYQWRVQVSDGSWFKPIYFYADEKEVKEAYTSARNVIRIDESRWVPPQEDEK